MTARPVTDIEAIRARLAGHREFLGPVGAGVCNDLDALLVEVERLHAQRDARFSAGMIAAAEEVHREARWQLERGNPDDATDVLLKVEGILRTWASLGRES